MGVYGFGKGIRYDRSACSVTDAKIVWSWTKFVESNAEFF